MIAVHELILRCWGNDFNTTINKMFKLSKQNGYFSLVSYSRIHARVLPSTVVTRSSTFTVTVCAAVHGRRRDANVIHDPSQAVNYVRIASSVVFQVL